MSAMDVVSNNASGIAGGKQVRVTLEAARDELIARGVEISEVFRDGTRGAHFHNDGRVSGPDRGSYRSSASFRDPDGNGWLFQEVTTRLPGRTGPAEPAFASVNNLASALRRAEAAHGEHGKRTGQRDANWPDWHAAYMVGQAGTELPT